MDFLNLSLSCRIRSFVAHLVKEIENLLVGLGLLEKLCPTLLFATFTYTELYNFSPLLG